MQFIFWIIKYQYAIDKMLSLTINKKYGHFYCNKKCEIDSDARRQYLTVKSLSTESAKSSASSRGSDTAPGPKGFGGSYSAKTGG